MHSNSHGMTLILLLAIATVTAAENARASGTYDEYFSALGHRESGGDYSAVNQFGYIGKYQFGEAALITCRFYETDGSRKNDWQGSWSTEAQARGVNSKDSFLTTGDFQEFAIRRFNEIQWAGIVSLGLTQYIGKTVGGIKMTRAGMIGGSHLLGAGNLRKFLVSDGSNAPKDGNGVPITEYIQLFSKYETPFH